MPETMPTVSPYAYVLLFLIVASIVGAWIAMILRFALGLRVLPPNTPRIVPWGPWSVLLSILLFIGIQIGFSVAYTRTSWFKPPVADGPRRTLSPGEVMSLSASSNAAILAAIPLLLALTARARLRDFGLTLKGLGAQAIRGVVAYPLLAPVVFGVMAASVLYWGKTNHPLEDAILNDRSPAMVGILVLAAAVLAPAAEELIFRGVLLGWLTRVALNRSVPADSKPQSAPETDGLPSLDDPELDLITAEAADVETRPFSPELEDDEGNPYASPRSPMSTKYETVAVDPSGRTFSLIMANVIVSLIFAALHGAVWPTPIPIFFLSLGLGFLYQRTGSILPSTFLHMTFNGVSTLLMFLTISSPPTDQPKPKDAIPPPAPTKVVSIIEVSRGMPMETSNRSGVTIPTASASPARDGA